VISYSNINLLNLRPLTSLCGLLDTDHSMSPLSNLVLRYREVVRAEAPRLANAMNIENPVPCEVPLPASPMLTGSDCSSELSSLTGKNHQSWLTLAYS